MSKTPEEKFNNINIEPDTIIQSFRFIKIDGTVDMKSGFGMVLKRKV
jgi:hypothetical protein